MEQENNQAPHISIISQYIKDFSFENPEPSAWQTIRLRHPAG